MRWQRTSWDLLVGVLVELFPEPFARHRRHRPNSGWALRRDARIGCGRRSAVLGVSEGGSRRPGLGELIGRAGQVKGRAARGGRVAVTSMRRRTRGGLGG